MDSSPEGRSRRRIPAGARGGRSTAREQAKNVTEMHKIKAKVIAQDRGLGVGYIRRNREETAADTKTLASKIGGLEARGM